MIVAGLSRVFWLVNPFPLLLKRAEERRGVGTDVGQRKQVMKFKIVASTERDFSRIMPK